MSDHNVQQQLDALRAQMGDLTKKLAQSERARVEAEKRAGEAPVYLQPGDAPLYELAAPYFSPDDVYYPEGAQFEDITGLIVPNEVMIPLNEAARQRVDEWLASQPSATRTPPLDLIIQSAMELRPRQGDAEMPHKEFMQAVMASAIEKHYGGGAAKGELSRPPTRPQRPDPNIPLMSNTKINNQVGAGSRPAATRLRQAAVDPANKAAPPTGGRSTNIGAGAPSGVVASR